MLDAKLSKQKVKKKHLTFIITCMEEKLQYFMLRKCCEFNDYFYLILTKFDSNFEIIIFQIK